MKKQPPRLANWLLLKFLREDLAEEVIGDLEEKFRERPSKINYWYQVLNYIRPFALRKKNYYPSIQFDMFKNYFIIGWRNMAKHKMYSAINIGGFALGIAACILLALYINSELTYDSHYENKDRLFRVVGVSTWEGEEGRGVHFPHPFADVLADNFPDIERVGQYNDVSQFGAGAAEVRRVDRLENSHEDKLVYMDQGLIDVLELKFIAGNPSKALTHPNSMVITRTKADKYFRGEDAVGKSLIINDQGKRTYTITGVVEDFPAQSHINYDFIMTHEGWVFFENERTSWCCSNWVNYVRLRPDASSAELEKKLMLIANDYIIPEGMKDVRDANETTWLKSIHFELQPIGDVYLNAKNVHDDVSHGDIRFIWLFGSIAVFILVLACINFVNLSTARSASRAKEVGIRKVVGSLRSALVRQFLTESCLFSFIAIIIGIMITVAALPAFNQLTGKLLAFPWQQWWLIPALIAGSLVIGIVAGLYPSFYLSSFRPAKVLKGAIGGNNRASLRSALVVFQFTISTVLIIGTLIVNKQMNYLLDKELGFDKDQVVLLDGTVTLGNNAVPLKNELTQLADVQSVSITGYLPLESAKRNGGPHWLDDMDKNDGVNSQQWSVDHDYVKTMGLKLTRGRDFSIKINSDSQAMIINEALVKKLNMTDPIGKKMNNFYGSFTVIGVVEDFHFNSMKENITPVAFFVRADRKNMAVKVRSTDMPSTLEAITAVWKKFSPNQPIRYSFLDDQYARTYDDVKRFRVVLTVFASLAIIVACLGLFALSAFMIEQRGKEISIRMVLGAPMSHILRLLSQSFVLLVVIAFVVATPLAWYGMNIWLQDYAYKIDIGWDVFVITGVVAIAISLLTIGYQSIKASLTNPVVNLKSE